MRCCLASMALLAVVGLSCDDGPAAPTTGAVKVSVTTTGGDLDEDGYEAAVDGERRQLVDANGAVVIAELATGAHSAALSGVAANCTVQEGNGPNPRPVTVTAGDTAAVDFEVRCAATGAVKLAVVFGDDQDGKVGRVLDLPFLVQVTDAEGAGVAGIPVSWTVTSGDGALDGEREDCSPFDDELGDPLTAKSVSTTSGGFASVSFVPAWFGPTIVTVEVDSLEGSPATFTIDASDSRASLWIDYPFDQVEVVEVVAGPQRALDLTMGVTDALGDGVPGVAVTWEVTSGKGKLREIVGCSQQDTSSTTVIVRTASQWGASQVSFQPTAFGITTVTATVPGVEGSPVTFTLDATLFEIVLYENEFGEPVLIGPDYSSDATVPVGATVEWWNTNDSARIASTSAPPGGDPFDSGTIANGGRFQFVPPVAGTWEYVDQVSGATGTLTAEGQ